MTTPDTDRTAWLRTAATRARGARPPFALCYHGVGPAEPDGDPHGLMVPETLFLRHLDVLERQGQRLVGIDELWSTLHRDPKATGIGALTFDDGLADTLRRVVRLTSGRDVTVTAYIPTGLMGQRHPHLASGGRVVDRSELLGLAEAGIEVGAHSVDHADLRRLDAAAVLDQLRRSRATLEDLLGRPVRSLAYPFGSFDDRTMRAAEEAGYTSACACSGPGRWEAFALPREPVFPSTSPRRLRVKVAGLYGPVHAARRLRPRTGRPLA